MTDKNDAGVAHSVEQGTSNAQVAGSSPAPRSKAAPDWERIEADYRAGVLSLREIAAADGNVTEGAIRKRAKRDLWERDLQAKINLRAEALVRKAEVRTKSTQLDAETERVVIEANAQRIAQVRGEHRADIARMRALVLRLLAECEAETGSIDAFERLGAVLRDEDEGGADKLNDIYRKAISLPTRIKGVKELAEALKTLVGMEREAYGLQAGDPEGAKGAVTVVVKSYTPPNG